MVRKSGILVIASLAASSVLCADQWNKKTVLTVNETILVPGATLVPGKYVVKLVDSLSNRHIVQITNEREDEVFTTILAIPNYRLRPTGTSAFQWWETPRGNPPAIRAWFYPGDNFGQEFAYPKGLSAKIAQAVHQPVPTVASEKPAELKTAPLTTTQPSGQEIPFVTSAPPAPRAPLNPELLAQARPPAEPTAAPAPQTEPPAAQKQLPATASPFGAYGAAGLVALVAGLALRAAARLSA
jgi:hypothetical protein